jgi:hypothetical protein
MDCIGKMIFISVVFFIGGWFARASRMEKEILEVNSKFESFILDIQASISEELKYSRIERDRTLIQNDEVLLLIEAHNKKQLALKKEEENKIKAEKKEAKNEAKSKLEALKNNSNGIKK